MLNEGSIAEKYLQVDPAGMFVTSEADTALLADRFVHDKSQLGKCWKYTLV